MVGHNAETLYGRAQLGQPQKFGSGYFCNMQLLLPACPFLATVEGGIEAGKQPFVEHEQGGFLFDRTIELPGEVLPGQLSCFFQLRYYR